MKSSKLLHFRTTAILLVILVIALAVATFIESATSVEMARKYVYNALWFEVVLTLLTLNVAGSLFYYRSFSWDKIAVPVFHIAFVLIMVGAFFTRYTGMEGTVYIREGGASNEVIVDRQYKATLPFTLHLTDFVLERYPGSHSPSSYSSFVTVNDSEKAKTFDYHIYMNHILKYRGWRFFQSSYDEDEKGTVLSASRDVIGTPLTYAGYILSMAAMLLALFMPGTLFRKQLAKLKNAAVLLLLLLLPVLVSANRPDPSMIVPRAQATEFGELVVQDNRGRMKVLNTLNNEFMRKIYGKETFEGLTSDQVVLSMAVYPEYWSKYNLIKIKNKELIVQLQLKGKYVSFSEMFSPDGQYKLYMLVNRVFMKPQKSQTKAEKALLDLDDRVNIINRFFTGAALAILPIHEADNNKWFSPIDAYQHAKSSEDSLFLKNIFSMYLQALKEGSPSSGYKEANEYLDYIKLYQKTAGEVVFPDTGKIKSEVFYNRSNLFSRLKMVYGITGFLVLILFIVQIFRGKEPARGIRNFVFALALILFGLHAVGIGLRWYIGGFVPLSNAYETMLFISIIALLTGLFLRSRQPIMLPLSLIMAFMFLFVAGLNSNNPEIGNLVPVLKSPWLSIHVAVITSSYSLFSLIMMISLVNLFIFLFLKEENREKLLNRTHQMSTVIQILHIIGLYLLTAGSILGAIWANESWGRYWGWDPKETWALISILVYAFVSHMRLIPAIKGEFWFNMASFWAFSFILMTFFGVNYFLSGMHSYAGTADAVVPKWLIWAILALVLFTVASGIKYYRTVKGKEK